MKIQLLNCAKRTLKITAAAALCLCFASSSFGQEPVHAIHHPIEVLTSTERGDGDVRPVTEIELTVHPNSSPTGIFTVKTEEENILIQVLDERLNPVRAEITKERPGHYVVNISNLDNGLYNMVVKSEAGTAVRELIKREANTEGASSSDNRYTLNVDVYPNPTSGIFFVKTQQEDAVITILDRTMTPIVAPISVPFTGSYRVDLTNFLPDVYFVQVLTKRAMVTERIVKR